METLKIAWFNWRCIKHPLAGGAEVYTHEIAKRLSSKGHETVLITSRPPGLPAEEVINGYKVIRQGGKYTVYFKAREVYGKLKKSGWAPDIVIDEINTIPFLTPCYVNKPITILIHQLCRECWKYAIHPLMQKPGWLLEKALHKLYVRASKKGKIKTIITVSESTRQDLTNLGYPPEKIRIVYNGIDWEFYKDCGELVKEKAPIITYLGRITPYKRVEDILFAWRYVRQKIPYANLVIAGRPEPKYLEKLVKLTKKLNLKSVEFRTNIPAKEKKILLVKASALVYTSIREGWGQTILEAAACKTPAIAYKVPGLRDAIKHMETGILVSPGNTMLLAQAIILLLSLIHI